MFEVVLFRFAFFVVELVLFSLPCCIGRTGFISYALSERLTYICCLSAVVELVCLICHAGVVELVLLICPSTVVDLVLFHLSCQND